jgi:hypothetical protein
MEDKKAWKKFQAFFVFSLGQGMMDPGLPDEKVL